ncbi:MAG: hypothetical protein LBG88_00490 [Christensenellaceae bacterium]|nr:hypothetical protein [Christensenellaceae bacterium]
MGLLSKAEEYQIKDTLQQQKLKSFNQTWSAMEDSKSQTFEQKWQEIQAEKSKCFAEDNRLRAIKIATNKRNRKRLFMGAIAGTLMMVATACGMPPKTDDKPVNPVTWDLMEEELEVAKQKPMYQYIEEFSQRASAQLDHIAFDVISTFEGTHQGNLYERFGQTCSNMANEFSVGLWQCNGETLNGVLYSVFNNSPYEAMNIFGPYYNETARLLKYGNPRQIQSYWTQNGPRTMGALVSKAFATNEGIDAQLRDMNFRLAEATKICDKYGLTTCYGLTAMLDMCVQRGISGANRYAATMIGVPGDDLTRLNHMVSNNPGLARTKIIIAYAGGYNKDYKDVVDYDIMRQPRLTADILVRELREQGYDFDEREVRREYNEIYKFKRPDARLVAEPTMGI